MSSTAFRQQIGLRYDRQALKGDHLERLVLAVGARAHAPQVNVGGGCSIGSAVAKVLAAGGASVVVAEMLLENARRTDDEIRRPGRNGLGRLCEHAIASRYDGRRNRRTRRSAPLLCCLLLPGRCHRNDRTTWRTTTLTRVFRPCKVTLMRPG